MTVRGVEVTVRLLRFPRTGIIARALARARHRSDERRAVLRLLAEREAGIQTGARL